MNDLPLNHNYVKGKMFVLAKDRNGLPFFEHENKINWKDFVDCGYETVALLVDNGRITQKHKINLIAEFSHEFV